LSYGKLITCHPHPKKNYFKQTKNSEYPSMDAKKKLIAAVNQNNAYEVRKLLIKGTDPNARVSFLFSENVVEMYIGFTCHCVQVVSV
jgi:hypothetical protein